MTSGVRVKIVDGRKPCSRCGEWKKIEDFNKDGKLPSGFNCTCRDCINDRRTRARRKRGAEAKVVTGYLGGYKECADCGEWKAENEFSKGRGHYSGLQSRCRSCRNKKQRLIRGTIKGLSYTLFAQARARSKQKDIDFRIDRSWVTTKLEGSCEASGIPFDVRSGVGYRPFGPSIDRVDNTGGYVEGNTRVVSFCFNQGKRDFEEIDFIAMCVAVAERHADDPAVIQRLKELRNAEF